MKHYATLLLLIAATLLHTQANAFAQGITIKVKDESLENVFKLIQKQSSYSFVYSGDQLKGASKVSLSVVNESIRTVLDMILKEQPFRYEISEAFVIIKKKQSSNLNFFEVDTTAGNPIDLFGRVVDLDGKPIAGATVTVRATGASTATGADGSFIIKAEERGTLIVTNVGYETKLVRITGGNLMVKLDVAVQQMKEVVISTGYQKVSSERFVGSYSQLDSAAFHRRAGMGIIDRLDGTTTGILFNRRGNQNQYPIQIRGISTLGPSNAQLPLIVVDNFPMDDRFRLDNINPNDVESITVLKDAAAASIWGTRAGNGVIVVSTKRGGFNQPLRVSVSTNVTIENRPDPFFADRISTAEFIDVERMLFSKGFYDFALLDPSYNSVVSNVVEMLDRLRSGGITSEDSMNLINIYKKNDVRNELKNNLYRNAIRQQHYVNVGGGANLLSYQLSFGLNPSRNNIQGSQGDNQYTMSSNTVIRPFKGLEINTGLNYTYSTYKGVQYSIPNAISPYDKLKDDAGGFASIPFQYRKGYLDTVGEGKLLPWHYSPLEEISLSNKRTNSRFAQFNFGVNYQILNWLKLNLQYRYVNGNSETKNLKSIDSWETRDLVNRYTNFFESTPYKQHPVPIGSIMDLSSSVSTRQDFRGGINVNKTWAGGHQISGLLQAELAEAKGSAFSQRLYGYDDNTGASNSQIDFYDFYPINYAAFPGTVGTIPTGIDYTEEPFNRSVSLLGNISYSYKSTYTLFGSFRRDGVNVFGVNTNNKWKPLWSIGTGWAISNEKFYNLTWMPSLRLRLSYGYTGNVRNDISGKFTLRYNTVPNYWTNQIFATPGNPPNPELRWESNRIINFGLDFGLINNRITGSLEAYTKKSIDLISGTPVDPSSGVDFLPTNYATMSGKGFELSLNSTIINKKITWRAGSGLSYNKTIVKELYVRLGYTAQEFVTFGLNATPGKIAFGLASFRWMGLDSSNGDPQGYLNGKVSTDYRAIFSDSVSKQVFHGSSIPLVTTFLRNEVAWKGISLSFNIVGKFNFYFREPTLNINHTGTWGNNNYLSDYKRRWQQQGDELKTDIPSIPYPANAANSTLRSSFYEYSEIHVKRADNIRLQDIRISYSWNNLNKRKFPFQNVQIFFYPNNLNLFLWRAEDSKFDPEFDGMNTLSNGLSPKTWTIGLNMTF